LLDEAHAALDRRGAAVSRFDEVSAFSDARTLSHLANDFEWEIREPRLTARTDYEVYHDLLKLALMTARGGLHIQRSEAARIGETGLDGYRKLRHSAFTRRMIPDLLAYDAGWEPLACVRCREDRSYGWVTRISFLYEPFIVDFWDALHRRHIAQVRLLIDDLAITHFRADHGRLPERLAELVPEYLAELPDDPFSGRPLVYRRTDDSYALYSVGENGRDDGGTRDPSHPDLDVFLDDVSEAEAFDDEE
jgi:hypothetical protein